MRKAAFFILLCWAAFGFFLYLGYSENFDLPQFDLPIEYAYLPMVLRTQKSAIIFGISGLALGLISYAIIFPSNGTYYTRGPRRDAFRYRSDQWAGDKVSPQLSKSIDSMIKKHGINPSTRFPETNRVQNGKMGMAIIDGRTVYSRRFSQSPAMLEKRASDFTIEEAWAILRTDFWDTKRRNLKRFNPEIYEQIMYWENHLDEYFIYMNMKLLFNLPYVENDFWVRRRR